MEPITQPQQPYDMPVGEGVYYAYAKQVGVVYETYTFVDGPQARPGVSILLHDGSNLGNLSFSAKEADQFLTPLGDTGLDYEFSNVGKLHQDYRAGVFSEALHYAEVAHISHTLAGK